MLAGILGILFAVSRYAYANDKTEQTRRILNLEADLKIYSGVTPPATPTISSLV